MPIDLSSSFATFKPFGLFLWTQCITRHLEAIRNTDKLLIIQRNIENSLLSEVREVLMTNRWADRLTNILDSWSSFMTDHNKSGKVY